MGVSIHTLLIGHAKLVQVRLGSQERAYLS